jgi:hypothetical protein
MSGTKRRRYSISPTMEVLPSSVCYVCNRPASHVYHMPSDLTDYALCHVHYSQTLDPHERNQLECYITEIGIRLFMTYKGITAEEMYRNSHEKKV